MALVNFDVDSYKTRFLGGARAYLFFCLFSFPTTLSSTPDTSKSNFMQGMGNVVMDTFGAGFYDAANAAGTVYDAAKGMLSPFGLGAQDDIVTYLVKATSLPASHFEEKIIDWQALPYKMAGDRTYDDWTVTFNIDEKGLLLQKFFDWQHSIQDPATNVRSVAKNYMRDQQVHMVDYSGNSLKQYKLIGAWPKSVNAVALDYSSNEIATVEITFSYQYHTVSGPADALIADLVKRGAQKLMGIL